MLRAFLTITLYAVTVPSAPAEWHLQWSHLLPPRKPAWEHTPRMPRDNGYRPALSGDLILVGCEHNNALLALNGKTGKEAWRFHTNGPIRFAPSAAQNHILVGSDDGWLYCLTHNGKLLWKHRGGPGPRKVIGHERLISAWPVSASPLVKHSTVYTVAGYWPVDGITIDAIDLKSGNKLWSNNAAQFRPGGSIHATEDHLILSGHGRGQVLDRKSGRLLADKPPKTKRPERPTVNGINGNITGWSQSDSLLAVGTTQGVFCFAKQQAETVTHRSKPQEVEVDSTEAEKILQQSDQSHGYCLIAGLKDGRLLQALLQKSSLHIVAIDPDPEKVRKIRNVLDAQGLFQSHRLDIIHADPKDAQLPPYFANLILSESSDQMAQQCKDCLRPYGGALVLRDNGIRITRRNGPLPGAADWRQEFCNAANTLSSKDQRVKAPLGLLWYGGMASHGRYYFDGYIDHQSGHGLNPQPVPAQIVEGRMILQSQGRLAAIDIYTGRVLWESKLPEMYSFGGSGGGLGIHSKKHKQPWKHPEAMRAKVPPTHHCRASGFNSLSLPNGIYLCAGKHLLRFDPRTGKQISQWQVPLEKDLCWGGIRASRDTLVLTAFRPQDLHDAQAGHDGNGGDWAGDRMPMTYLLALDRQTGKMLWHRKATWGFINRSGYAIGNEKVYAVDLLTSRVLEKFKEAKRALPGAPPTLLALDLNSGKEIWTEPMDVYAQNLVYSAKRDLLIVPCRNLMEWEKDHWADRSVDVRRGKRNKNAPGKMRAFQGANGKKIWEVAEAPYHSPHILIDDLIIDRWGFTYDLTTGKRNLRRSPVTGQLETWGFRKSGCNHLIACDNLVTWRCAFYDLTGQSGVMKLIGMDAGCSPTLLPAGGVLNVPNFGTHHKRNRMTAMALIHRPENDLWTDYHTSREKPKAEETIPYKRIGYNFGAPGDCIRNGTLWLRVSNRDRATVQWKPKEVKWHQGHSTASPVTSSWAQGLQELSLPTHPGKKASKETQRYTVRLYFNEGNPQKQTGALLDIWLEGKPYVEVLNLSQAQGKTALIKEVKNVPVQGHLDIRLIPKKGEALLAGVELILEKEQK